MTYYRYLLPTFFLFLDTTLLGYFQQHTISILLCFYAATLLRNKNTGPLLFSLLLLATQSHLLHGTFGLSLLYLLPLSILILETQNIFQKSTWLPHFFLISCLLANELIIRQYYLQMDALGGLWLTGLISANLVVLLIFMKFLPRR